MRPRGRSLRVLRGLSVGLAAAALLVGAGACKRRELPKVELLDEDGAPPETEGVAALAPTWPPAERALLGDDLLVHWLTEEGSPAAHLRLLVPTHGDEVSAAAAAVVAEAIALDLRRWTQRYGASVELRAGVDRFEIAVHGQGESLDALIAGLGRVVAQGDPAPLLDRARDAVASGVTTLSGDALALTTLVGLLDGRSAERERFDRDTVMLLDEAALADAWKTLVEPARVLLIVHAGRPVSEAAMTRLSKAWPKGGGRLSLARASDQAHERLRPQGRERGKASAREAPGGQRLRGEGTAPLHLIETAANDRSGSHLYLGRIIPLADARDRALARLAQRLLQEEIDARLTIVGDRGLFAIRLRISRAKPTPSDDEGAPPKEAPAKGRRDDKKEAPRDLRARRLVEELDAVLERIRARLPRARLAQAAELWLGARVVQASLTGEDWTSLWSESLDLSLRDAEIASAIARDAQTMLAITPEELVAWSASWLDFERGEPGWAWVAASNEADLAGALAEVTRVEAH